MSQHLRILLSVAVEPQKLGKHEYISLELSFNELSKVQLSETLKFSVNRYADKKITIMHYILQ